MELELLPPTGTPYTRVRESQSASWNNLRVSLLTAQDTTSVFPPLCAAMGSLIPCLDGLEVAARNRQDYEELTAELVTLTEALRRHMDGLSSKQFSDSMERVTMTIETQIAEIREILGRTPGSILQETSTEEAHLMKHYRQILLLFRQLQTGASISTWSIINEHLADTRLEDLNPVKQANYDSSTSTEINRRGCTEGTRIGVLDGLDKWLYGSVSSSIYWMDGMAGTGKTTIASTFCERVERRKLLAASFFCTRSSAECRNVARIVPTIAYQLARYSTPFQSAVCQVLERNSDIGSKNVLGQFELLLKEPLQQVKDSIPHHLVVVIDALDECDSQHGIELVLDTLLRHAIDVPLKFVVTSRPERDIYEKMLTHPQSREVLHLHDIEKSLVGADIELYLKEELEFMSPSQPEIGELARRSGALFIYAATLVRYISGKRSTDPRKRLRAVLDMTTESTRKHTQIDALYTTVLESAFSENDLGEYGTEAIWAVLRTVLLVQEPVRVEIIAKLAGIDDIRRVALALQPLRSVLHQSEVTHLVSTLHASFPDFMFSQERSGSYFFDIPEHCQLLARRCFLVMKDHLRFNICALVSSFVPDKKIENLQDRIKQNISPTLTYACRYWASHVSEASKSGPLIQILDEFLRHRALFWMEVLSLRRELPIGIDGLLKVQKWLTHTSPTSPELLLLVDDMRSFVTTFAVNPSSQATPHIYLSSLAFCPQSNLVYKYYRTRVKGLLELKGSLMERRESAPLATWTVGSEIVSLALSPDGTRVAIGCLDKTVSILSAYDGMVQVGPLPGHPGTVNSVAFSQDGGRIVSASLGSIRVWNAYNGTRLPVMFKGHMRSINSVSFSPDGTRVVSCGHDTTIRIWNAYDGTPMLDPLNDHTDLVFCVKFSPNGDLIASASADQTVRLWNSYDGSPASSFLCHTGMVKSLAFTPDGARLVSAASNKTIRVWDVTDGSLVYESFEGYIGNGNALAISPDSTRIAAACSDNAVRVWHIDEGKLVAGPFFGHSNSVKSVAYSPDGTRVFSGSLDMTIRVWNVRDGMLPPPPLPSGDAVPDIRTVIFCPDSRHFLSSGQDKMRIWDTNDGSFVTIPAEANFFPTPLSILSPNGSHVASSSKSGTVQVTSTTDGSLVAGPFDIELSSLSAFWFSHNNKAIVMGCKDGTIKVCDLSRNSTVGSFTGHRRAVSSLAESPDCSLLVSYSDFEFVLRVWNTAAPALYLTPFSSNVPFDPISEPGYAAIYDEWSIREDGWAISGGQRLLFWLPPDVASAWCSPYATLAITRSGTLQVPKQRPLVGDQWAQCYVSD